MGRDQEPYDQLVSPSSLKSPEEELPHGWSCMKTLPNTTTVGSGCLYTMWQFCAMGASEFMTVTGATEATRSIGDFGSMGYYPLSNHKRFFGLSGAQGL